MTLLPRTMVPRLLVFTGALLLISVSAAFYLVRALEARVRSQVDLTARLYSALLTLPGDQEIPADLIEDILSRLDFPIVITDPSGKPQAWRNVPGILETPLAVPFDSLVAAEQKRILDVIRSAQQVHQRVRLSYEGIMLGWMYYTPPPLLRVVRALPWILLVVGFLSLAGMITSARTLSEAYARELWALFAKGLAHQMGTPLSSLLGWVEHLKASPEELPQILAEMEQDLEDLRDISLRFSRIGQPPRFSTFDLGEAIHRWVARWKRRWLRGVSLSVEAPSLVIRGDEILLRWAVENLVKNAMEASEEGGIVQLVLQEITPGSVRIRVVDQGSGIPEEVRRNPFTMRISTKPRGWGMGLWVVRKIVEDWHGGKVRLVSSRPGHTEFEILLPRGS